MATLWSLVAKVVVIKKTSNVTSDAKIGIMTNSAQDSGDSSANAPELPQSSTKPSIFYVILAADEHPTS